MTELSSPQKDAIDKACSFLDGDGNEDDIFRLFGAAGTGKSTLIAELLERYPHAHLCALSGKAVDVLRNKGMNDARTLHSLLYKPILPNVETVEELSDKLRKANSGRDQAQLRAKLHQLTEMGWTLSNTASEIAESDEQEIVILDEASMVGQKLFEQLLSLGVKVIAVGDPWQLPPVKDKPFLTLKNPDVLLTEIHRQAKESGVLRLATEIREGNNPAARQEDDCFVTSSPNVATPTILGQFTQTICGTHKNRRYLNTKIRHQLGYTGSLPQQGERLICTKNITLPRDDNTYRVYNGQELTAVTGADPLDAKAVGMKLAKAKIPEEQFTTQVYEGPFLDHYDYDPDRHYRDYRMKQELFEADFGHAITAHKAQGSEYSSVFVYHDGFGKTDDEKRQWLYTAVTRAQDGVVLCSPFVG